RKVFLPKHNFLPNDNIVALQKDDLNTTLKRDDNGRWYNTKVVKHPRKLLQHISNAHTNSKDDKKSMHAYTEESCSFDAYIKLDALDVYSSLDDKLAFLELN